MQFPKQQLLTTKRFGDLNINLMNKANETSVSVSFSFDNHPKYNTNTTNTINNSEYMKIKIYIQRKNNENKDYIINATICI